jgi:MFS family permease
MGIHAHLGERNLALPRGVIALGFVSLFMDVSSEMVHALLPVYLTVTLGASAAMVGLIEGLGQGMAQITKLFSGVISDWVGQRKPLAVLGYSLSAVTKPIFYLAGTADWILVARVADRFGKGIRGTPRDAMVADMVPPEARSAAFGLRQSMDSFGAFAGPLLAIGLMLVLGASIPQIFLISVVPALIAVAVLVIVVREPEAKSPAQRAFPLTWAGLARLQPGLWLAIGIASLMTMARISDAFLILRASDAGVAIWALPLVLVVLNAVDTATSWPVGVLADRIGKRGLLLAGFAVLALANLVLGLEGSLTATFLGIALWGLHMGLTQGLLAAMVADAAPADLRGTAFGLYNLMTGIALLIGNAAAGLAWTAYGPGATFLAAAALAGASTGLGLLRR